MGEAQSRPTGPDLVVGVSTEHITDGSMLWALGHVGEASVLVARCGDEFFAISASCCHYSGPPANGIMVPDTVRCPWHHVCFSPRTGTALPPPVLCLLVERCGRKIAAANKNEAQVPTKNRGSWLKAGLPRKIIIVGGGAAAVAPAGRPRSSSPDRVAAG